MNKMILEGIQCLIAWFEVWLCYQFVYAFIPEYELAKGIRRVIVWANILTIGVLMAVNRNILFFSGTMFVFYVAITIICQKAAGEENTILISVC